MCGGGGLRCLDIGAPRPIQAAHLAPLGHRRPPAALRVPVLEAGRQGDAQLLTERQRRRAILGAPAGRPVVGGIDLVPPLAGPQAGGGRRHAELRRGGGGREWARSPPGWFAHNTHLHHGVGGR